MVPSRSARMPSSSGGTRSPRRWKTEPCSRPLPILWMLVTQMSAPASIAHEGRSGWKGRCAPHASSTISGADRRWQTSATARRSALAPYGVGLVISAPLASGWAAKARSNASADGGWARFRRASQDGSTHTGSMPERISPDTTDLWASRPISSFSCGPATASIAAFTDRELPHVEKNVCSACTASAISSWARWSTRPRVSRSSSPPVARTSPWKTASPSTSRTAGSAPRACLWPGGVNDSRPSLRYSARASRTGARV